MERRNFTRVGFQAEAIITCGKHAVRGRSENVSLKGMFFHTSERLSPNKNLRIKLFLDGNEDFFVKLTGKVVRTEEEGVGVQFNGMNYSTFMDLKNIVSLVVGDENYVISEFTSSLQPQDEP